MFLGWCIVRIFRISSNQVFIIIVESILVAVDANSLKFLLIEFRHDHPAEGIHSHSRHPHPVRHHTGHPHHAHAHAHPAEGIHLPFETFKILDIVRQYFCKQFSQFRIVSGLDLGLVRQQQRDRARVAIDGRVIQRREPVAVREIGQGRVLLEHPVDQADLAVGTCQVDRRLAKGVELFRVGAGIDQRLNQAGSPVDHRRVQRRVAIGIGSGCRLPLAKQPLDGFGLSGSTGQVQWPLAKRGFFFQQFDLVPGGCGVNHASTVVGFGLQIGALADEPFRNRGFAQPQSEVQRGVADLIRRVDVGIRSHLRLSVGEVTAQHGQVDFFDAVVALKVGGIMPRQWFERFSFSLS